MNGNAELGSCSRSAVAQMVRVRVSEDIKVAIATPALGASFLIAKGKPPRLVQGRAALMGMGMAIMEMGMATPGVGVWMGMGTMGMGMAVTGMEMEIRPMGHTKFVCIWTSRCINTKRFHCY